MENMELDTKLKVLRENRLWKCMNKNEVLAEHETTWQVNGLIDLNYKEIKRIILNDFTIKITVDLLLNNHWTDDRSGIDDSQLA